MGPRRREAVRPVRRLSLVLLPCCALVGLRVIVRRRFTEPHGPDDCTLPHDDVRSAAQERISIKSTPLSASWPDLFRPSMSSHAGDRRQPEKAFKAGESLEVLNSAIHNEGAAGSSPAKLFAIYVVEKGKPLVQPVQ